MQSGHGISRPDSSVARCSSWTSPRRKSAYAFFLAPLVSASDGRIGFHAFRHSLASLLAQTAGMKVDQHQLRHSSARTTLEIHTHILGEEGREAMQHESVLLNGQVAAFGTSWIRARETPEDSIT